MIWSELELTSSRHCRPLISAPLHAVEIRLEESPVLRSLGAFLLQDGAAVELCQLPGQGAACDLRHLFLHVSTLGGVLQTQRMHAQLEQLLVEGHVLFFGVLACEAPEEVLLSVDGRARSQHIEPILIRLALVAEVFLRLVTNGVVVADVNGGVGEHEVLHVEWFADLQLGGFLDQAGALWEGGNVVLGLGLVHELPVVSLHYEHGAGHHGEVHVVEVLLCGRRAEDQLDAQALDLRGEQVVVKVLVHVHDVFAETAVVLGDYTLYALRKVDQ